jgi:hypothetical protein
MISITALTSSVGGEQIGEVALTRAGVPKLPNGLRLQASTHAAHSIDAPLLTLER